MTTKQDPRWNELRPGEHLGVDGRQYKAWGRDSQGLYAREIKPSPEMIAGAKAKRDEYQIHSAKIPHKPKEYVVAAPIEYPVTPRLSRADKKAIKEEQKTAREKVRRRKAKARSRKVSRLNKQFKGIEVTKTTDLRTLGLGAKKREQLRKAS